MMFWGKPSDFLEVLSLHQTSRRWKMALSGILPLYNEEGARYAMRIYQQLAQVHPNGWELYTAMSGGATRSVMTITGIALANSAVFQPGSEVADATEYVILSTQRCAVRNTLAYGKAAANVNQAARTDLAQLAEGKKIFNVAGYEIEQVTE